jgi:hypothetical protein
LKRRVVSVAEGPFCLANKQGNLFFNAGQHEAAASRQSRRKKASGKKKKKEKEKDGMKHFCECLGSQLNFLYPTECTYFAFLAKFIFLIIHPFFECCKNANRLSFQVKEIL